MVAGPLRTRLEAPTGPNPRRRAPPPIDASHLLEHARKVATRQKNPDDGPFLSPCPHTTLTRADPPAHPARRHERRQLLHPLAPRSARRRPGHHVRRPHPLGPAQARRQGHALGRPLVLLHGPQQAHCRHGAHPPLVRLALALSLPRSLARLARPSRDARPTDARPATGSTAGPAARRSTAASWRSGPSASCPTATASSSRPRAPGTSTPTSSSVRRRPQLGPPSDRPAVTQPRLTGSSCTSTAQSTSLSERATRTWRPTRTFTSSRRCARFLSSRRSVDEVTVTDSAAYRARAGRRTHDRVPRQLLQGLPRVCQPRRASSSTLSFPPEVDER